MALSQHEKIANKHFFAKCVAIYRLKKKKLKHGNIKGADFNDVLVKDLCQWAEDKNLDLAAQLAPTTSLPKHKVFGLTKLKDFTDVEVEQLLALLTKRPRYKDDNELKAKLCDFINNLSWVKAEKKQSMRDLAALDAARNPSIKECIQQNKAVNGILGTDKDFSFILQSVIVDPKKITQPGKYIASPVESTSVAIADKIQEVLNVLQYNNIAGKVELAIPLCNQAHWTLLTVTLENGKITAAEHSDSCGGPNIDNGLVQKGAYKQVLGGKLAGLAAEDFADEFTTIKVNRSEQKNGWSCMDYTLQHALRKAGVVLYNPDTGEDYIPLDYQSGTGSPKDTFLRESLAEVIIAKQLNMPLAVRKLSKAELEQLDKQWQKVIKGNKTEANDSIAGVIKPGRKTKDNSNTLLNFGPKLTSFVFNTAIGIASAMLYLLSIPFRTIRFVFDLGAKFADAVIEAFTEDSSVGNAAVSSSVIMPESYLAPGTKYDRAPSSAPEAGVTQLLSAQGDQPAKSLDQPVAAHSHSPR